MKPSNEIVLDAAAAGNLTSAAITTEFVVMMSAQALATGTIVGTLKVQASNDKGTPVSWNDITGASVAISSATSFLIPKLEVCYQWIRLVYTATSGSGNLTVKVKSIGY